MLYYIFLTMEGFNDVLYFYKLFVLECVPVYTALLFIISVCADILLEVRQYCWGDGCVCVGGGGGVGWGVNASL